MKDGDLVTVTACGESGWFTVLNRIDEWARKWELCFNTDKCETMRITHWKDTRPSYFLGKELKCVNGVKDLGVHFTRDLSWSEHVGVTINKAKKVLGIIKRTVGTRNQYVFSTLYKTLVRPITEYVAPV